MCKTNFVEQWHYIALIGVATINRAFGIREGYGFRASRRVAENSVPESVASIILLHSWIFFFKKNESRREMRKRGKYCERRA